MSETNSIRFRFDAEHIYAICVVLAFGLLFFANADQQESPTGQVVHLGIGKSFYVPCGVALLCSFFINKTTDKITKRLNWMIVLALISTLLHLPTSSNVLEWTVTRYIFAILCFRDIRQIDPKLLVYYATIAAPFIVFPHYLLTNPFGYGAYRYAGFYGDPNFLAIALNLLITLCYLSFKLNVKRWIRLFAAASIIGAIPLILVGVSRGGILGLAIILWFILRDIYKSSKWKFALIVACGIAFSGPTIVKLGSTFVFIEERFGNESSSDANGAHARIEGIQSCFNVFSNRPDLIPFGIGPGQTVSTMQEYRQYGYICHYVIHNTFISLLYEFGLVTFLLFMWLYYKAYLNLKRNHCFLLIGLLLSDVAGLFLLPGVAFMPAWILLFFVLNVNIETIFPENLQI